MKYYLYYYFLSFLLSFLLVSWTEFNARSTSCGHHVKEAKQINKIKYLIHYSCVNFWLNVFFHLELEQLFNIVSTDDSAKKRLFKVKLNKTSFFSNSLGKKNLFLLLFHKYWLFLFLLFSFPQYTRCSLALPPFLLFFFLEFLVSPFQTFFNSGIKEDGGIGEIRRRDPPGIVWQSADKKKKKRIALVLICWGGGREVARGW